MKPICALLIFQFLFSCNNDSHPLLARIQTDTSKANYDRALPVEKFTINRAQILKDFDTWYYYTYHNVRLSEDFTGLNIDSVEIDKITFLHKLMTEKVVAFKIRLLQGKPVYKLYKFSGDNKSITSTTQQLASIEMKNFEMEGKQIPPFNFTDVDGNTYSTNSTKGKTVVLKCWFINCTACVQEFPACNRLVEQYGNQKGVIFISLASDLRASLKTSGNKNRINEQRSKLHKIVLWVSQEVCLMSSTGWKS